MRLTRIFQLSFATAVLSLAASCSKDNLNDESVLHLPETYTTEFDEWLQRNYVEPYNVRIEYHLPDNESHFEYWVTPPDIKKSIEIAKLLKHTTIEAMNEMMTTGKEGEDPTEFVKKYFPKVIYLVGNFEIAATGQTNLASAENGLQINILGVNYFDRKDDGIRIASTMLHEFTHILDGIHNVPDEFRSVTPNDYVGNKYDTMSYEECIKLGFLSPYARSSIAEDIAVTGGYVISATDAEWEKFFEDAGESREKLQRKYNIIKAWLADSYNIDAMKWRDIYLRRISELDSIDWTNLND